MTRVGTPGLTAAVADAGALAFMPAHNSGTPEALVKDIARVRDATDQPFGVNFTILPARIPAPWEEYMRATVESGVKAVETAGQNPEPYLPLPAQPASRGPGFLRSRDIAERPVENSTSNRRRLPVLAVLHPAIWPGSGLKRRRATRRWL